MKIEKNAHICQRCGGTCFDPIDVKIKTTRGEVTGVRMCYECVEDAVRRSGGRIERTTSEVLVMWREP